MQEVELKFLSVDISSITKKIVALGAQKEYESELVAIYFSHDVLPVDPFDKGKETLRLRSENGKWYLTHKTKTVHSRMKSQEEHEVVVADSDETLAILSALGFRRTKPVIKHRTHYVLGKTHFEIEHYPGEKSYLEIETQSEKDMEAICKKLGFSIDEGSSKNVIELYPHLFVMEN